MDSQISRMTTGMLWLLLMAVLVAPFAYVMASIPQAGFLDNVMSGMLATAAALIGGIPVALWIDRAIKHREEKKKKETERTRELELLELLRGELDFTGDLLNHRKQNSDNSFIQPLKSNLWRAVSSAGKLNLISNHRLLNRIASAYYAVDIVKKIEEQCYKATRGATVSFSNGKQLLKYCGKTLGGSIKSCLIT